jgi:hypothetical protein
VLDGGDDAPENLSGVGRVDHGRGRWAR